LCKFNGKLCLLYVRNVWICRGINYLELREFNGKLCTLYVWNFLICKMIEYQEFLKFNGNCVHYMYEMSGLEEKLNIKNCVNSTRNYAHYMCGYSGF